MFIALEKDITTYRGGWVWFVQSGWRLISRVMRVRSFQIEPMRLTCGRMRSKVFTCQIKVEEEREEGKLL